MLVSCMQWLMALGTAFYNLIDNMILTPGVSLLGVFVACFFVIFVIDNFVGTGQ